jgi:hypothetical protein
MQIDAEAARQYVDGNLKILQAAADPASVLEWIETNGPEVLATLSLGAKR